MNQERRKFPKVDLGGDANLLLAGVIRHGALMNLSPSGIQIECRQQFIEQLSKSKSEAGLFPEFELEFELPTEKSENKKIKSTCNVSYCRRQRQDSYLLGLSFVELSEQAEKQVGEYLNHPVAA